MKVSDYSLAYQEPTQKYYIKLYFTEVTNFPNLNQLSAEIASKMGKGHNPKTKNLQTFIKPVTEMIRPSFL